MGGDDKEDRDGHYSHGLLNAYRDCVRLSTFLLGLHIGAQRYSSCGLHFTGEETEARGVKAAAQGPAAGK